VDNEACSKLVASGVQNENGVWIKGEYSAVHAAWSMGSAELRWGNEEWRNIYNRKDGCRE
jgi:hypothetical protein